MKNLVNTVKELSNHLTEVIAEQGKAYDSLINVDRKRAMKHMDNKTGIGIMKNLLDDMVPFLINDYSTEYTADDIAEVLEEEYNYLNDGEKSLYGIKLDEIRTILN